MMHSYKRCFSWNLPLHIDKADDTTPYTDVISIAFNNVLVISQQIRLVRKYLGTDITYIVADNSSNPEAGLAIKALCIENGVSYIRLPKSKLGRVSPSYSHAGALNWIYRKIVKKRQPDVFGFIDHDIFPIAPISITLSNQNPIYGNLRESGPYRYMWPGLSFFYYPYVAGKKLDFMPVKVKGHYLDTGGGNWRCLYDALHRDDKTHLFGAELREGDNFYEDSFHLFDNNRWLHTINGSYWKSSRSKDKLITTLLNKY